MRKIPNWWTVYQHISYRKGAVALSACSLSSVILLCDFQRYGTLRTKTFAHIRKMLTFERMILKEPITETMSAFSAY